MKKLTAADIKAKDALVAKIQKAHEALFGEVQKFNETRALAFRIIEEKREAHNALVEEANDWRAAIVSRMEDFCGDKSDTWQESDAGIAYEYWKSSWDDTFEEIDEFDEPEEIELGEESELITAIEERETEVGGMIKTARKARALGREGGQADALEMLQTHPEEARRSLDPGQEGWDTAARNAGAAEINGVPGHLAEAYYAGYLSGAAEIIRGETEDG